ncbi:glutamate synthase family protein, putative [Babesia ovata]|uniref:Glutamate synthase family protein, putative n=1 Tax=Babesia ovata TaxID=189622 RepID=A0A2H6KBG4_9APIC|nr:glutamate synthase family protein, putative [Babesia ovata]GBE60324.1 glutamate synthase family protein, putative [Babesia ovata]
MPKLGDSIWVSKVGYRCITLCCGVDLNDQGSVYGGHAPRTFVAVRQPRIYAADMVTVLTAEHTQPVLRLEVLQADPADGRVVLLHIPVENDGQLINFRLAGRLACVPGWGGGEAVVEDCEGERHAHRNDGEDVYHYAVQ